MNANDRLERRLTEFYESESPPRAPDWVLRSALPDHRRHTTAARANPRAVEVPAHEYLCQGGDRGRRRDRLLGALGLSMLRPSGSSGVGGLPTASPSPLLPPPPSASPITPPALTETFTSARHGFSIQYPSGWVTRPATDAWTTSLPDFASANGDVIYDPVLQDHLWIMVASQPLAGKAATQWVDDLLAGLGGAGHAARPSSPSPSMGPRDGCVGRPRLHQPGDGGT